MLPIADRSSKPATELATTTDSNRDLRPRNQRQSSGVGAGNTFGASPVRIHHLAREDVDLTNGQIRF